MALLEKYQEYFVNYTKPEYQPRFLHLTADGWKLLIRENLTPIIEDRLRDLEALFADERLKNEFIKKFQQT